MAVDQQSRPLATLKMMAGNPRRGHRVAALCDAIRRYGFGQAITVNDTTGHALAGNGRIKALRKLKSAGEPPPAGITDSGDDWLVPVLVGNWPPELEAQVALALNGGLNDSLEGEFDKNVVAEILQAMEGEDLSAIGVEQEQATQFILDQATPYVEPQVALEGIQTVEQGSTGTTVTLKVSVDLGKRVRQLTARGTSAEEILTKGVDRLETENDRKGSKASAAKAE